MTGFGEARHEGDSFSLLVELRAVNNRYLKVTVRGPDPYPLLEAEVEKVIRRTIKRGTLLVQVRINRQDGRGEYRLNSTALLSYLKQVESVLLQANMPQYAPALMPGVLQLPGVAQETSLEGHPSETEWKLFEDVLSQAVHRLQQMRVEEGRAMALELQRLRAAIVEQLNSIREQTPRVVGLFRNRLKDRLASVLKEEKVAVSEENLIREVALFADRCDINEEIARLDSHLVQFDNVIEKESDSPGRKLEFLVQEMGREVNTIGSKASDSAISRLVVEIKAKLENIRELIQNVE